MALKLGYTSPTFSLQEVESVFLYLEPGQNRDCFGQLSMICVGGTVSLQKLVINAMQLPPYLWEHPISPEPLRGLYPKVFMLETPHGDALLDPSDQLSPQQVITEGTQGGGFILSSLEELVSELNVRGVSSISSGNEGSGVGNKAKGTA